MDSLETTKGMFDAVEKTHRALLEQCAETIKNLFKDKQAVFIEFQYNDYGLQGILNHGCYSVYIESLKTIKEFDTWLEMVEWIARFEIIMRKF